VTPTGPVPVPTQRPQKLSPVVEPTRALAIDIEGGRLVRIVRKDRRST
jgi:hypothetical protein